MIRTIVAAMALTAFAAPAIASAPVCPLCKPVKTGDLPFPERKEKPKESYGLIDSVRLFFMMDGEKDRPLEAKPVKECGERRAYAPGSKCADFCRAASAPCDDVTPGDA